VPHPALARQRLVANPVRVDGRRLPAQACSALGADTEAVLREAGFSAEECEALRQEKVV
jgi:crotonobetainyl-CoA:carnitine CoA-transferase CaiB-like acyl-CoA transferase